MYLPILTDADLPDDSTLSEVPALAHTATDVPATIQAPTGVVPPARRNSTSSFGQGAAFTRSRGHQGVVTRSHVRHVTFTDVGHRRSDDTAATSTMDIEDWTNILDMNASLQSNPTLGVPKNYKELMKLNNKAWLKSLNAEL